MDQTIISRLLGKKPVPPPATPTPVVAAPPPVPNEKKAEETPHDAKLFEMLERIQQLTNSEFESPKTPSLLAVDTMPLDTLKTAAIAQAAQNACNDRFIPREPTSIQEAGLNESEVEALILKYLLARGNATGRQTAEHCKLPFVILDQLMRQMKFDQLLVYRGAAEMNDYCYQLTDLGRERARRLTEHCSYYGAAPVTLASYIHAVREQSLTLEVPTRASLEHAFEDLLINRKMLDRLGPAINSGRGMFLFGPAGNGKTSIAERITRSFGQVIWIPRAIGIDGEIIRMFDPNVHEEMPLPENSGLWNGSGIDRRWVRIRRPTVVVGGELTMENLEVCMNTSTGINEAPVQLKSNCGTLVIDDFGRQRMRIDELLNRWIVPLEKRYDFLNLPNGKKIQVPFDQLIVFSTNLEPKDLVDEAFLRRIPYKIEVVDPEEHEFRELFRRICPKLGFEFEEQPLDYLIEKYYKQTGRRFRNCQPRDILQQVRSYCMFQQLPLKLSPDAFDWAVENYFSIM